MGLFWNRKKKESAENEPAKSETPASGSGFLNRFLGREETEVKPTEPAAATPAPVEVASELYTHTVPLVAPPQTLPEPEPPAPVSVNEPIAPAPVEVTTELTSTGVEKQGLWGRLFNRSTTKPLPAVEPNPPATATMPLQSLPPAALPPEPAVALPPAAETGLLTSLPPTPVAPEGTTKPGFFSRLFSDAGSGTTAPLTAPPLPPAVSEEQEQQKLFYRFKKAVQRTRQNLVGRLDTLFLGKKTISPEMMDDLEEILIGADIGVQTTLDLVEQIRSQVDRKLINDAEELKRLLRNELLTILKAPPMKKFGKVVSSEVDVAADIRPYVMMMVGVNGVGKTTTIAKLANLIKNEGNDVIVCAADTFRAAASDQLAIWANRTGIDIIQQKPGTDPAAVVYDSLSAAKARDVDVVIIDTAGRLHNKVNLMQELEKMSRIAGREVPEAPHEVLLVLDAATGQNGLEQARQFVKTVPVTGLVLTKLDGTAKGGIVVAIAKELGIPIRYVGTGEQLDDLVVFSPEDYVNGLFE